MPSRQEAEQGLCALSCRMCLLYVALTTRLYEPRSCVLGTNPWERIVGNQNVVLLECSTLTPPLSSLIPRFSRVSWTQAKVIVIDHRPGLYHTSGIVHCRRRLGLCTHPGLHHRCRRLGLCTHPGLSLPGAIHTSRTRSPLLPGAMHTSRLAHHPLTTSSPDG